MAYSDYTTIRQAREQLGVTVEEFSFLPDIASIEPTPLLEQYVSRYRVRALDVNTEKARSELLITPIVFELESLLSPQVSVFSGKRFDVNPDLGLNGYLDFIVTRSADKIEITAPAVIIIEAKAENIVGGLGQCIAAMVAAQQFNHQQNFDEPIYGCVTTGDRWRFLGLDGSKVAIDSDERSLLPISSILGILGWMAKHPE